MLASLVSAVRIDTTSFALDDFSISPSWFSRHSLEHRTAAIDHTVGRTHSSRRLPVGLLRWRAPDEHTLIHRADRGGHSHPSVAAASLSSWCSPRRFVNEIIPHSDPAPQEPNEIGLVCVCVSQRLATRKGRAVASHSSSRLRRRRRRRRRNKMGRTSLVSQGDSQHPSGTTAACRPMQAKAIRHRTAPA